MEYSIEILFFEMHAVELTLLRGVTEFTHSFYIYFGFKNLHNCAQWKVKNMQKYMQKNIKGV